jgi:hypothetical protein
MQVLQRIAKDEEQNPNARIKAIETMFKITGMIDTSNQVNVEYTPVTIVNDTPTIDITESKYDDD